MFSGGAELFVPHQNLDEFSHLSKQRGLSEEINLLCFKVDQTALVWKNPFIPFSTIIFFWNGKQINRINVFLYNIELLWPFPDGGQFSKERLTTIAKV